MKVKTELLKELVNKSINGVSNNKLIPITQLMGITKNDNNITLITTDATNYLYVYGEAEDTKDTIQVTVFAEQFSKLVSKMTSNEIELEVVDNSLHIVGNGDYTIELPLDESGELIKYPDPYGEIVVDWKQDGIMKPSEIQTVIESIKPSLATSNELPSIMNYYVGDNLMATDRYKIASFDSRMMVKDVLISARLMDLLSLTNNEIKYFIANDHMLFKNDDVTIYSKGIEDVEEYPVQALEGLINDNFKSICKVNKSEFIALLERISLFVGKYDDRAVRLYFEKNGIRVSNKSRKSNEVISYSDSKKHKDYDCTISVDMLLSQLKAYAGDIVELHYNNDKAIKFVDGAVTQIVALMEE